ncbi:N-acetylneuraminate synthase family protein, partial [Pelagibacteraceae bacterium]|nr:N-acetylneuraminate synthase family protein [Pelagibacteraceae bacterium]
MYQHKSKIQIIAEAGVNHNGSLKNALKLVDMAKKSKADFVKFQYFNPDEQVTGKSKKANYQIKNFKTKNNSQKSMLKKLSLDEKELVIIKNYCKKKKIKFLLSIFNPSLVKNLKKFEIDCIKIPSGEITNYPLLREIGKLRKEIILSTGLSTMKEIRDAIKILIKFKTKKNKITILHCTSDYPPNDHDLNLLAIPYLKKKLKLKIGYSDHTIDHGAGIISACLGATIIEKHLTLSNSMRGPDHKASLEPKEFLNYVNNIKKVRKMLGSSKKVLGRYEKKNLRLVRKSIYAKKLIKKGEIFSET